MGCAWEPQGEEEDKGSQPGLQIFTLGSGSVVTWRFPTLLRFLVSHQNFSQDKSWLNLNSPYVPDFKLQLGAGSLCPPLLCRVYTKRSLSTIMILVGLPQRSEVIGPSGTILYKPLAPTSHSRGLGQA